MMRERISVADKGSKGQAEDSFFPPSSEARRQEERAPSSDGSDGQNNPHLTPPTDPRFYLQVSSSSPQPNSSNILSSLSLLPPSSLSIFRSCLSTTAACPCPSRLKRPTLPLGLTGAALLPEPPPTACCRETRAAAVGVVIVGLGLGTWLGEGRRWKGSEGRHGPPR